MILVDNRLENLFIREMPFEIAAFAPTPPQFNDKRKLENPELDETRHVKLDDVNNDKNVTEADLYIQFLNRTLACAELQEPVLCEEGEGGTYFVMDENNEQPIAVFKPNDEEPFSPNNPKAKNNLTDSNNVEMKKGIRAGESALREVAAYLLDHAHFAGVPFTTLVTFKSKTGSLQVYVPHECQSWDLGPSKFTTSDVHKIGLLDIRLFNVDRHGGNILVTRLPTGELKLIPIDHGFSLPDSVEATDLWFEWFTWPQAKVPFDEETISYIHGLNVAEDANILRNLGIREECVRTMIISSTLLKRAALRGFTLFQIANMLCRKVVSKRKAVTGKTPVEIINEQIPQRSRTKFFLQWVETQVNNFLDRLEMHQQAMKLTKSEGRTQPTANVGAQLASVKPQASHRKNQSSVSSLAPFVQQQPINGVDNSSLRRSVSSSNLADEIYLQNLVDQRLINAGQNGPTANRTTSESISPTTGLRRAFSNCRLSEL